MPLPEGVIPDPDRPFVTVRTATRFHDPDEVRRYATREECLVDLGRWQDTSLVRQDPYYHLGVGYQGDDDTYTFEVYENGDLRLQVDIDRLGQSQAGPWARPTEERTAGTAFKLDDYVARYAQDENHDAVSWAIAQDKSTPAGKLLADLSDPAKIDANSSRAIMRTFEGNCERAQAASPNGQAINFERILRHAIERHRKTMDDTPQRTWDSIKTSYAAVFDAAGGNLNQVPYQDGYPALYDLTQRAVQAAHCPDRQEDKLKGLLATLDTCAQRKVAISDLNVDIWRAREGLDRLIREAGPLHNLRIERDPHFPEWADYRAAVIAAWTHALADPDLKQHLPHFDYESMKAQVDRLTDPEIPTVFHPRALAVSREPILNPTMYSLAEDYERALNTVGGDANLLPYSHRFVGLKLHIREALDKCARIPVRVAHIASLDAQLEVAAQRKTIAADAAQDLTDVSDELVRHINWSKLNRQPVHEAPGFNAWRDKADQVASRCEAILQDPRLAPHFDHAGASEETARTAILFLRNDNYQKPPSPQEIAAQRQARAQARADSREESASMSA